jgi:hypothetical protein
VTVAAIPNEEWGWNTGGSSVDGMKKREEEDGRGGRSGWDMVDGWDGVDGLQGVYCVVR